MYLIMKNYYGDSEINIANGMTYSDANFFCYCKNISDVFEVLGFYVSEAENDDLEVEGFADKYSGRCQLIFSLLADLFKEGSHLHWKGEDGGEWHWTISEGNLLQEDCEVFWDLEPGKKPGEPGRVIYRCVTI